MRSPIQAAVVAALCTITLSISAQHPPTTTSTWDAIGGDHRGTRFSPLDQITPDNVAQLVVAWTFHTGEAPFDPPHGSPPALETTPLMVDGTLFLSTPRGQVVALNPRDGTVRWRADARVPVDGGYGDFVNRGLSTWEDPVASDGTPCKRRIYLATIDARLLAFDASNGAVCQGFGTQGAIDLRHGLRIPPFEFAAYQMTSPPVVVNGLLITGSSISDNSRTGPASGEIRAFDARTGVLRWSWDPIPQDSDDPAASSWQDGSATRTGGANAWSTLVADSSRDLVFIPTTSPSPDYFGGMRLGDNRHANSIVALRASTGELVWAFQTVHHDIWDYDNAAPPALTTITRAGQTIDVVLQATKTGMLFVLDRATGVPVFPVEERPVPASDVEGERASATQPFTVTTPPLSPHGLPTDSVWGPTPTDRAACRATLLGLRNEGIFTPPSLQGTLAIPSNIGGAHWGGVAVDSIRQVAIIPVNRIGAIVQLIPAEDYDRDQVSEADRRLNYEYTRMRGTPFVMRRRLFIGPGGAPCTPPPFGELVAVDLTDGSIRWRAPLGDMQGGKGNQALGTPNLGGPIVTASGITFIGATIDRKFRAFETASGRLLWEGTLPAGARATPMTYAVDGRQYVVIAAGGGGMFGDGDAIVAFALPDAAREIRGTH